MDGYDVGSASQDKKSVCNQYVTAHIFTFYIQISLFHRGI